MPTSLRDCWRRCRRSKAGRTREVLRLGVGPDTARIDNKVVTAKYNVFTFLPVSFISQFQHFSNLYFLVIFVIALIGDSNISSLNWFQSPYDATGFILSLMVVVGVSMGFDLAYDIGRHLQDRRINNRNVRRITANDAEELVTWKELRPGDIVIVEREQRFPADLLFLEARPSPESQDISDFDPAKCYVETSNIDGETNLKVRFAPSIPFQTQSQNWWERLVNWTIEYDLPKPALEFSGLLTYKGALNADIEQGPPNDMPLDFANILLRESVLKNTHEIVGVVLYAGTETKGVQSSSATRNKISNAVKLVNRAIVVILCVGFVMVLISAGIASRYDETTLWYLKNPTPYVFGPFWSAFFTYVILYSNLLPISLVIATTITNFVQAQFVNWDIEMYDETKNRAAKCQTLELAQEIGQVSFVFSDKTGTLTRNEMKLVGCTTGNDAIYGLGNGPYEMNASDDPPETIFSEMLGLVRAETSSIQRERARVLLASLAICHTVLVEGSGESVKYNAEGPDEEALVQGVAKLGYKLIRNVRNCIEIESSYMPVGYSSSASGPHRFEIIGINHFDSDRKRMSAIVRKPDGTYDLIVKGADSVMIQRLVSQPSPEEESNIASIGDHLDSFAQNGLRTLVFGRRSLRQEEVEEYASAVAYANAQLGSEKDNLISEAADKLERELHIIGATAIEDRLQDGVPDTLKCLRDAGIKTWVLTGDKVETAINIGHSAGLLTDLTLIELTSADREENLKALQSLNKVLDPKSLNQLSKMLRKGTRRSIFTPRHTRGVNVGAEASGEDPFGMGKTTRKVVGSVVENGFHAVGAAYTGGKKAINHIIRRHDRSELKEAAEVAPSRSSVTTTVAAPITRPSSTEPDDTANNATSTEEASSKEPAVQENTFSIEVDNLGGEYSSVIELGEESSRLQEGSSRFQDMPRLIRQTSTVIPPETNYEASNIALIVSGAALTSLLHDPKLKYHGAPDDRNAPITDAELLFLSFAKICKVVIACRVSPRQKAQLVRLVRKGVKIRGKEPITLAIGDGQNDVAMIQESRVGVGVAGREGSQAVNAADFSIGQFRFLRRLLLVHGRWNYRRMALLVLFIFYAHILPVLVAFAYNLSNMWSGTTPFPFVWVIAYSYIVVIPCIFLAAFNRDISSKTAFKYPSIYVSGRANLHMGRFKILEYVFKSILHATVICAFIYAAFAPPTISYLELGTTIYWCILLAVLSRLALECFTWTIVSVVIYFLALIVFPILEVIIYGSDISINTLWGTTVLFGEYRNFVWITAFFVTFTIVSLDLAMSLSRRVFFPNLVDIAIEIDRGYTRDVEKHMDDAAAALDYLTRPKQLPHEAVARAVNQAEAVSLAPKFRSAYAQDVPDGQTVGGVPKSRFGRFSHNIRRSLSFTKRRESAVRKVETPKNDAS